MIEADSRYEPPADPTFKDKNKCVHTYVSPRVAYDMGRQLTTNSAFRTKAVNDRCGGSPRSKHLEGLAMDVRTMEMTNDEKVEFVRLCASYGALAFGFYNRFIHFDNVVCLLINNINLGVYDGRV